MKQSEQCWKRLDEGSMPKHMIWTHVIDACELDCRKHMLVEMHLHSNIHHSGRSATMLQHPQSLFHSGLVSQSSISSSWGVAQKASPRKFICGSVGIPGLPGQVWAAEQLDTFLERQHYDALGHRCPGLVFDPAQ